MSTRHKIKELVRNLLRKTNTYRTEYRNLNRCFSVDELEHIILQFISDVPYYNYRYKDIADGEFDIKKYPILTKDDILGHEREFLSKKYNPRFCFNTETGGSSGKSLSLFYSLNTLKRKDALPDSLFAIFGKKLNVAMLRGTKPSNGKLFEVVNKHLVLLSSYSLTPSTIDDYLDVLKNRNIECVHAYPSSITILAKLIKDKYTSVNLPNLKGIFASSEIFSKEDQRLVRDAFGGVDIIDYYSMSELCCAAYSLNGSNYMFNNRFGYVEFVDTEEKTDAGNKVARIVATSVMNSTMPFIRYDTGDMAEIDNNGNVVSIIGRTSDFIYTKQNTLMPCIITPRERSFKNVIAFQYYQPSKGVLEFHVMVNEHFNQVDFDYLSQDVEETFPHRIMDSKVVVKEELKKTQLGKLLRLVKNDIEI
jgi:phenylacetate-CoA ligase